MSQVSIPNLTTLLQEEALGFSEPKKKKILLLNGPNLNCLGRRPSEHYGQFTLEEAVQASREEAERWGYALEALQSNFEGDLVTWIQNAKDYDALLINAGAYTHYSYAIRDALELYEGVKVELHISDLEKREAFRSVSVIREVCDAQLMGEGLLSYVYALREAVAQLKGLAQSTSEGRNKPRRLGLEAE